VLNGFLVAQPHAPCGMFVWRSMLLLPLHVSGKVAGAGVLTV
jgi:hypothetical protein